ncbi:hypothetical protein [uncultured Alcanivorax sp.]|uniref:hypothetical protein n=1 Tax=uncultured Alcanivorax sp. TaxID=191215 RepID=UPI0030DB1163
MKEHQGLKKTVLGATFCGVALLWTGCRPTFDEPVRDTTGEGGEPGAGYTVQCSGWFPDWIARSAPPEGEQSFQLAQGYPLGIPVAEGGEITGWEPFEATTSASWLNHDFRQEAQRLDYLEALKQYVLEDLAPYDFVPQNEALSGKTHWYHVPMMTSGFFPREPRHGLTEERGLRASEQSWLSADAGAYGIGLYNKLGGYTVGQVFRHPDPMQAEPGKGQFIDGTVVVKVLFAEYDPSSIVGPDPLLHSPAWQIQAPDDSSGDTFEVRLLQMDVAVKDPRSAETGWVFATYVYDESLPAASPGDRWYNLTPIGLAWGNDPDVTSNGDPDLDENWINPSVPSPFAGMTGKHGRLNGPVDNPESSCISCHSTAQVNEELAGTGVFMPYKGAGFIPGSSCSEQEKMNWFRNIQGSEPFGITTQNTGFCGLTNPPRPTPPVYPLDYSLQLQLALALSKGLGHPNPCLGTIPSEHLPENNRLLIQRQVTLGAMPANQLEKRSTRGKGSSVRRLESGLPSWEQLGMYAELKKGDKEEGR